MIIQREIQCSHWPKRDRLIILQPLRDLDLLSRPKNRFGGSINDILKVEF